MQRLYSNQEIGCVQAATDIIGDKWSPLLLRALAINEAMRFSGLQDALTNISPRILSARLSKLESNKVIEKKAIDSQPQRTEYCLTEKGNDLLPIIDHMAAWGEKYPQED